MKEKVTIRTANPKLYNQLYELAKQNRLNPTYAEKVAWNMLRRYNIGTKFRRQHIIDSFIVDFVSLEYKIIIEIDGDSHIGKEDYDDGRDLILSNYGFTIIHITNELLLGNGNAVEEFIENIIKLKSSNGNIELINKINQLKNKFNGIKLVEGT